jgi:tribbles-like protein
VFCGQQQQRYSRPLVDLTAMATYVVVPSKCYAKHLAGYLRLDGNPGINAIENVYVGPQHTYIQFAPSYGDLHSYVRQRERLKESEVCELFKQIVSIVNDCHRQGIVLRDLKLSKFVFRDSQQTSLKLETLDDGVVLADPDDDLLGEKHGCPAYVAPELLTSVNGRYSGRAADCWSLGVILYTMLVGRYPFHDADPSLLFGKIKRGFFQIPNSVTPTAKCLIKSLLRKNPEERLTTEDLLASSWFHFTHSPSSTSSALSLQVSSSFSSSNYFSSAATSTPSLTGPAGRSNVVFGSPLVVPQTQASISSLNMHDDNMSDQIVPDL